MGLTLVLAGEVQIDIRLLISLEPKECLERDIKSFFFQWFSTDRTVFVRHITARSPGKAFNQFGIKVVIMAGFTIIMGMQRIYLGNTGHCSCQR